MLDAALLDVVATYSGFGDHHTGTPADAATTEWLIALIDELGGAASEDPYTFERYAVTGFALTIDGEPVPAVPLFHGATGAFDTERVAVVAVDDGQAAGAARGLEPFLEQGAGADGIVLVVDGPDDLPVQCNRIPHESFPLPTAIAAGNWLDRLQHGRVRLQLDAALVPSSTANVLARFGDVDSPTVNITTPLTGWTPAAGERGTGLAAALAVATDLAADHRVEFSACSGHELDHLGLRHLLAHSTPTHRPTIHLGASIGAVEHGPAGAQLATTRMCLTTAEGALRDDLASILAPANWTMAGLEPPWPGEGGTWLESGSPVLSLLGRFSLFHTAHDTVERATTQEALALATRQAVAAARRFCEEMA